MKRCRLIALFAALLLFVGCADVDDDEPAPDDGVDETGVELTVDFVGDTDVAGFKFVIRECVKDKPHAGPIASKTKKDLEDLYLPGMIPEFENDPFDEHSSHLFADFYTSLKPGCYDVEVIPITKSGQPSNDCDKAEEPKVEVKDGKTTEVLLISQCEGGEKGGLDIVAALNHPPEIKKLKYKKFNHECDKVKVCATAFDPDGDPLEFEWAQIGGPKLASPIKSVDDKKISCPKPCGYDEYKDYVKDVRSVTSCVEFQLGEVGDYKFKLNVYDLMWIDGGLERFPDSSTSFKFPVYAMEHPDGVKCLPPEKK